MSSTQLIDSASGYNLTASGAGVSFSGAAFPANGLTTAGFSKFILTCTALGGTSTFNIQGSNDGGSNWSNLTVSRLDNLIQLPTATNGASVGSIYEVEVTHALIRVYSATWATGGPTFSWLLKNGAPNRITVDQGASGGSWLVVQSTSAYGTGFTQVAPVIAPATPALATVKASAGRLYKVDVGNSGVGDVWVKMFNSATPTLGTTVPVLNMYIPKGTRQVFDIADFGDYFSTAITYIVDGAIGLTDYTTAIVASTVTVNIRYT